MAQGGIFVFEADNADFKAQVAMLIENLLGEQEQLSLQHPECQKSHEKHILSKHDAQNPNRKRAARACPSCQKRKKRCAHTFTKNSDQQAEKETAEKVLPQLIHKEPVKFVGDLNPESVLTDLTQRSKDSPRISRVGIWVEQSRLEQEQFRRVQAAALRNGSTAETDMNLKKQAAVQRYSKIERGRRTLTGHQKNYLQAVGALRVLPKATQDALVTTYVACIDPLLPIIDCKKLLQEYKSGEASVFLVQAICLVACKTEEAVPYLRLYEDGPLMDPIPFARALHTGLDAAMKADLEADRFTKVQIMTLMSLHNDGPGGIEESSLHLTMAIHDAQTTGLHINTPGRGPNDQAAMLWWTLWTLDKFNACLGGRPLMIADRDIDIKRPLLEQNQRSQTLAVWLAMGDLLDKVIEFYRPNVDPDTAGWEGDFPSFEDITRDCSLDVLEESQRNLLEVCYNIIGILSCRAGGPASRSYNRRIQSADRIQQLTIKGRQAHLPPLPLVPYAISLSLTVAYRGLRDSHSDPIKTQADLASRCDILETLNKTWWTADAMAKLGRKALKNIQQPAGSDASGEQTKSASNLTVGDALEAEVAPCKYGTFDEKLEKNSLQGRPGASPALANGATDTAGSLVRKSSGESNGLQVLSNAAASLGQGSHSQHADAVEVTSISVTDPNGSTINPQSTNLSSGTTSNKRVRYNTDNILSNPKLGRPSSSFSPRSGSHMVADTPPSTRMTTITNTPTHTPLTQANMSFQSSNMKMNQNASSGVFEINPGIDPFCATYDLQGDSSGDVDGLSTTANLTSSIVASNLPPNLSAPSTAAHHQQLYNPRMSVPLHYNHADNIDIEMYNYNDLDNLFDGFFDLSMPTLFQDPLFEGAAYDLHSFNFLTGAHSGGPSGAGSIDMNYMDTHMGPNQQHQNMKMNPSNKYSMMNSNASMNMNEVNKVSPPSGMGANHWWWNEDDY